METAETTETGNGKGFGARALAFKNGDFAAATLFRRLPIDNAQGAAYDMVIDAATAFDDVLTERYLTYYISLTHDLLGEKGATRFLETMQSLWKNLPKEQSIPSHEPNETEPHPSMRLALLETKCLLLMELANRLRTTNVEWEATSIFEFLIRCASELSDTPAGDRMMVEVFRHAFDKGCALHRISDMLGQQDRLPLRISTEKLCNPRPILIHAWARNGGAENGYTRGIIVAAHLQTLSAHRWDRVRRLIVELADEENREGHDRFEGK